MDEPAEGVTRHHTKDPEYEEYDCNSVEHSECNITNMSRHSR